MGKKGKQIHNYLWKKYEYIHLRSKKSDSEKSDSNKSDSEKKHTSLFKKCEYEKIIKDMVSQYDIENHFKVYDITENDVVELVLHLFYPHLDLVKDLIYPQNIYSPKDFSSDVVEKLKKVYQSGNFSDEDTFLFKNPSDSRDFVSYLNIGKKELVLDFFKRFEKRAIREETFSQIEADFYDHFLLKRHYNTDLTDNMDNMDNMDYIRKSYSGLFVHLSDIKNNTFPKSKNSSYIYGSTDPKITNADTKLLSEWYNELFDAQNKYYMTLEGENKFLEQNILDLRTGCNIVGYILSEVPTDNLEDIEEIIEEVSPFAILGFFPCVKKIIKSVIDEYNDEFSDDSPLPQEFLNIVLKIFNEFFTEFLRYIYLLGKHINRQKYMENVNIDNVFTQRKLCDYWKYLFSDECDKKINGFITISEALTIYAENLPSEFYNLYFFYPECKTYSIFPE